MEVALVLVIQRQMANSAAIDLLLGDDEEDSRQQTKKRKRKVGDWFLIQLVVLEA